MVVVDDSRPPASLKPPRLSPYSTRTGKHTLRHPSNWFLHWVDVDPLLIILLFLLFSLELNKKSYYWDVKKLHFVTAKAVI